MDDELRGWRCLKGHVLGQVRKSRLPSGRSLRLLELYRHAVDLSLEAPEAVDVIGSVNGEATVRCDVCGSLRKWYVGEEAMREFLSRWRGRRELR